MKVWDILGNKPEFIMERNLSLGILQVHNVALMYWAI